MILRNSRNLLRYFRRGRDSRVSDGAARDDTLRHRPPGGPRVSQSLASARAIFREEPRSLEGEVPSSAGTDQGVSYRGARFTSVTRSLACQGRGPRKAGRSATRPVARAGGAGPPRAEPAIAAG